MRFFSPTPCMICGEIDSVDEGPFCKECYREFETLFNSPCPLCGGDREECECFAIKGTKGVSFLRGVSLGSEPYLIHLGNNVRVAGDVSFITHDGGTWAFRDKPEYADVIKYGRIHVGERSFIGFNVTVMPGVTIGKRCVVGAGSVVTKDVPDGMVVAGVPAKPLMTTEEYAQRCLMEQTTYDKQRYMADKKNYLLELLG